MTINIQSFKKVFRLLTTALIFFASINYPQQATGNTNFKKEAIRRHLNFLGSDLFEGRGTGTTGGNLAAKYLALEFERTKLKPIGSNKTFYQYVPLHGSKPLTSSKLEINVRDKTIPLKLNDDYVLLQAGEQTFIPNQIPLVFVGYGIISPEYDYNDYYNIDVEGKVVVFWDGEPELEDESFFDGKNPTIYSSLEAKQRIALSRGARGSIFIPSPDNAKYKDWDQVINNYSFEYLSLAYSAASTFGAILKPGAAKLLFEDSGYSIDDVNTMVKTNSIKSFPLNSRLSFKGNFKERDFLAPNIIGLLEGNDPDLKNSFVIVSAHYDHLGIGPSINNDSIYNGVFDNAAGVSVLIEIAKEFSKPENTPGRSIIFILLTGEESGLLGSKYYIDNPVVPLYKTVANINIDGVASFDKFKSVVGIGKEYSTLEDFLNITAQKSGLSVITIPPLFIQAESFTRSDQLTFASAGIPAILISEGLDYVNLSYEEGLEKMINFASKIYHTPFDDLTLPINYDAVIQHTGFLYSFIAEIANAEKEPEWYKGSPYINARLRSIAEKK
ncbi:MAG: M28 family peptidase [Bacteroidota bacterium]